jgi:Ca2+-binding RTX toxin-like protein
MRIRRFVQIALVGGAVGLVLISVLAATNTVPASKAGLVQSAISVDAQKPKPDCNGITVTTLLTGSGNVNGTNAAELFVGSAGVDNLDGKAGTDCIVGGGGNDAITGGAGTDVCIGGPGTDTFTSCETQIQ